MKRVGEQSNGARSRLSPLQQELRDKLTAFSEPGYDDFVRRSLPKDSCAVLGCRVGPIRALVKEFVEREGVAALDDLFYSRVKPNADADSWGVDYLEERMAIAYLIGALKISFDKKIEATLAFLPLIDSWCVCDTLCGAIKPKGSEKSELWNFVELCLASEKPYDRRVGLVFLLKQFLDESHIGAVLLRVEDQARRGLKDRPVSMGLAWLLCEAFVKRPDETLKYLKNASLDVETFKRTVQKIDDSLRVDDDTKREMQALLQRRLKDLS